MIGETIEVRGELYQIKRRVKIDNDPIVEDWKEHLNCDTVFKHQPSGFFLFCNHIPNISYEESTNESTTASPN
jgi:hypothetical protein